MTPFSMGQGRPFVNLKFLEIDGTTGLWSRLFSEKFQSNVGRPLSVKNKVDLLFAITSFPLFTFSITLSLTDSRKSSLQIVVILKPTIHINHTNSVSYSRLVPMVHPYFLLP